MEQLLPIIVGAVALLAGIILGKILFAKNTKQLLETAKEQAQQIISDAQSKAETLKKEKQLEAKEHFVQLKAEHEKAVLQRNQKLVDAENRIKQKEQSINQKDQNVEKIIKENELIKQNLNRQIEVVNIKRTELEKHQEEHIRRLEMPEQRFQKMFIQPQVVVQDHHDLLGQLWQQPVVGEQKIIFRRDHHPHRRKLPPDPVHIRLRAAIIQHQHGTLARIIFGGGHGGRQQKLQMLPPVVVQNCQADGVHQSDCKVQIGRNIKLLANVSG